MLSEVLSARQFETQLPWRYERITTSPPRACRTLVEKGSELTAPLSLYRALFARKAQETTVHLAERSDSQIPAQLRDISAFVAYLQFSFAAAQQPR